MTTYLARYRLWTEVGNIPDYLKTDIDREYCHTSDCQYSMIQGITPLRDAIIEGQILYVIDLQFRLWLFNSTYPAGIITPIHQVRRIYQVRGLLLTVDVNNTISRIVQVANPLDWYKIRYDNVSGIIAIVNHYDIVLLLTLSRELHIGYIDDEANLIITTRNISNEIRSVIGPIIVDYDSNITVLGLVNYYINRTVIINPFYRAQDYNIIDVDYQADGIVQITEGGTLLYQSIAGYVSNLSRLLSVTTPFKSFVRLRQNKKIISFIRDRNDRVWMLDIIGNILKKVKHRDQSITIYIMRPGYNNEIADEVDSG